LIRNEKPIVLFERHCCVTEKSEAIACARTCSHPDKQGGGPKKNNQKNVGPRRRRGTRGIYTFIYIGN
jgi:hypothetical protein